MSWMDEQDEGTEVEVGTIELLDGAGALEAVDRAQIDVQVATAKKYPRSVTKALREAEELATLDEETAASMFYVLPRGGKKIEGPSARLAEVMAYSWGNLRADADIVAEDRTHVTAMGTCFDLEKNVAVRVRVKRRITNKNGVRYNEDMIGVTSNAAISIALRNAVFKVIPAALANRIYHKARRASVGEAGTMTQTRQKALEWWAKAGATEEQVCQLLDVPGPDDIGIDELITLRGMATAVRDGESSLEQMLRGLEDTSEGTDELNEALKKNGGGPTEDKPKAATKAELEKLEGLRKKARPMEGVLVPEEDESIGEAIEAGDGAMVRTWIRQLSSRMARAGAETQGTPTEQEG